ncbi:sperm acrosome membrane-associated protein 4-like [Conger conger]|uniref:sperm acrosome membrane-associated protein 4-like n=2 Tax=Conger conger TaxID=82655 RepID=UPI002A5A568E|nr:sperm acrosome membrane-associated protein 4-like [Conger conger]
MNVRLLVVFVLSVSLEGISDDRSLNNGTASLTCNKCSVGLFGTCLMPGFVECDASEPNCYTGRAEFPSISGFLGFNTQGCLDSSSCNTITNGTILGAGYTITCTCCTTDLCNPVVSGAAPVQLSLSVAASAALLACMWHSGQY